MIYKLIRRVHLYSALVLGAFLLLYAGTAFFIFTSDWYPDNEAVTVVQGVGAFTPPTGSEWATNREAARAVEEQYRVQYGIHGRFQTFAVTTTEDSTSSTVARVPRPASASLRDPTASMSSRRSTGLTAL